MKRMIVTMLYGKLRLVLFRLTAKSAYMSYEQLGKVKVKQSRYRPGVA